MSSVKQYSMLLSILIIVFPEPGTHTPSLLPQQPFNSYYCILRGETVWRKYPHSYRFQFLLLYSTLLLTAYSKILTRLFQFLLLYSRTNTALVSTILTINLSILIIVFRSKQPRQDNTKIHKLSILIIVFTRASRDSQPQS